MSRHMSGILAVTDISALFSTADNHDFEDVEDTTEIDRYVARISRKGVMDVRHDRHTKVYLIPDDLTRHVLLSARNMQTWAHGVIDPDQPGVTEDSPPSSMRLKTSEQHRPKRQRVSAVGFDIPDINEGPITPRSTPECQTKRV
ncbi:hypothetical protein CROQUDRAFT_101152 [Cronartium quercuum f. sp. fusiforme G11]|uniref:Uncharacterized protein n=1 Tax=Cronartium quercuum f. sp. fusiforme G11 TaxID=708437 RepID=A0A9P6N946_9BASI|nr:hypothetical protein CROQUDRAFT_101152 [Cronartium quercuum f. sp. fusiforme G11]